MNGKYLKEKIFEKKHKKLELKRQKTKAVLFLTGLSISIIREPKRNDFWGVFSYECVSISKFYRHVNPDY